MARAKPDPMRSDLIYVGRLIDEKRVDLLIRAVAALAESTPDLQCVIVGDGPERERLEALAERLAVASRVVFTGRVSDERVTGLMRASRILVLPSIREGYGIVVVEAQACGLLPVVVRSDLSAAPDLVTDGLDGIVADPTVEGLAAALASCLSDPSELRRMRAAARVSAGAHDWDARALEMERIYRELAVAKPRVAAPRTQAVGPG